MYRLTMLCVLLSFTAAAQRTDFSTRFERSHGLESAPYDEVIAYYKALDKRYRQIRLEEAGATDTDYPLHVVYYSSDGRFSDEDRKNKTVLLINNGIHPGEPDGVDASMLLLRDAAEGKIRIPENVMLAVIPVFNIGGALNRGSYSRANQNGPLEYGFRGNAQNLDLNRDFTKMDALEIRSLVRLMTRLDPVLFIDNHVSNGADYRHVMTLLSTQADKLGRIMGPYLRDSLEPAIYAGMKKRGYDLVPYVNSFEGTPDKGWPGFLDGPRYASGCAALFQIFSFVPETHMLKPYKERVEATYALMQTFIELAGRNGSVLRRLKERERALIASSYVLPLKYHASKTEFSTRHFLAYRGGYKNSAVSGKPRLWYDRNRPFDTTVRIYDRYYLDSAESAAYMPSAYVLQSGWKEVLKRLRAAGVQMQRLERDTVLDLSVARIQRYETVKSPYEKHYLHYNIEAAEKPERVQLRRGDWFIPADQPARRFLAETLEPTAPDGFFAWNFFDAVLQQKEHFSDYIFEDEAAELLRSNPALRESLETAKSVDSALAGDGEAQLEWVYRHSARYEPVHLRHPVFKLMRRGE